MSEADYVRLLADLLSGDPARVRQANRRLYQTVLPMKGVDRLARNVKADLVLAEAAQKRGEA